MATENRVVTKDWTRVTETTNENFLLSFHDGYVEICLTNTTTTPKISGHIINNAVVREVDGYLWVRLPQSGSRTKDKVVITQPENVPLNGLYTVNDEQFLTLDEEIILTV